MVSLPLIVAVAAFAPQPVSSDEPDYVRAVANGEFLSDYYPEGALKRGEQGRVGFKIALEKEGWVGSCEITESSGFKALDRETCEIIVQYAKVKPVRGVDGMAIRAIQDGYISWRLPRAAAKVAVPSGKVVGKPDPIICRRDSTIGSIMAKTIQCLTRNEWNRQQTFEQQTWQELQGKGFTHGS